MNREMVSLLGRFIRGDSAQNRQHAQPFVACLSPVAKDRSASTADAGLAQRTQRQRACVACWLSVIWSAFGSGTPSESYYESATDRLGHRLGDLVHLLLPGTVFR